MTLYLRQTPDGVEIVRLSVETVETLPDWESAQFRRIELSGSGDEPRHADTLRAIREAFEPLWDEFPPGEWLHEMARSLMRELLDLRAVWYDRKPVLQAAEAARTRIAAALGHGRHWPHVPEVEQPGILAGAVEGLAAEVEGFRKEAAVLRGAAARFAHERTALEDQIAELRKRPVRLPDPVPVPGAVSARKVSCAHGADDFEDCRLCGKEFIASETSEGLCARCRR